MGDRSDRVIITIDGPAGTGKSTVAHRLAERLGIEMLDTGAMYRAAALVALESGIEPESADLVPAIQAAGIRFDWTAEPPAVCLGDRDVSLRIRGQDVNGIVSRVATQPALRRVLVEAQRRIAREHPRLVTEGRDQGSVVFPDATVRFYLDAAVGVRARRRAAQLAEIGTVVAADVIDREIAERDRRDSSRADGPLIRPEGAVVVDTSERSIAEVVDELERVVRERWP